MIKKLTMMRTMRLQAVLNASGKIEQQEDSDDEEERTANVMRAQGTGRYEHYLCYTMELGTGAYKTVYKGMNQTEAVEVAWNEMKLERLYGNLRLACCYFGTISRVFLGSVAAAQTHHMPRSARCSYLLNAC